MLCCLLKAKAGQGRRTSLCQADDSIPDLQDIRVRGVEKQGLLSSGPQVAAHDNILEASAGNCV